MKRRYASLLFVALSGLAPAVLGNALHWSPWLWGFVCVVTISGSLLLVMTVLSSGGYARADLYEPGEPEPPAAPSEQPYQQTRVVEAALPSSADGYDFLFSATVWWKPVPDHAGQSEGASPALAVSSIVSRAQAIVREEEPRRASFARYVLEGELGVPLPDRSGRVKAKAEEVTLVLAPADRERLRKLTDLRKDEEIWEHERHHERNKRRYLGDDVLKSTGSAVVWWLARHENEIEKAVDMIGPLAQITAAANDEEVPELFRHLLVPPVGGPLWDGHGRGEATFDHEEDLGVTDRLVLLLAAVGLKPDMDEYTVFVHRVVRSLEAAGMDEAAEEIRRDLLQAPDAGGDEEPKAEPSGEGDTAGFWTPGSPAASEGSPFTDTAAAAEPDVDADPGTFTPGVDRRSQGWWEASEDDVPPPNSWNTSQSPHRPAAPHPQDEDDEDEN
ncbi:hypothetical protein [Streptomyces eurythermus]|uniref:hypothetical protein n=1 Tax=Streptomyces eurythermus TaxID=42237 RepID=UPI0033F2FD3D